MQIGVSLELRSCYTLPNLAKIGEKHLWNIEIYNEVGCAQDYVWNRSSP
jgi:hypothetical protein